MSKVGELFDNIGKHLQDTFKVNLGCPQGIRNRHEAPSGDLLVLAKLPKNGCGCIPFWDHLALAGSMPFRLGWALLIRSSLLTRGSRSRGMGEEERGLGLVCGDLQLEGSAGMGEKRT